MNDYSARDLLRVAKRQNNSRRRYLLINPLQAKHLPVSPAKALAMMEALGRKLAARHNDVRLLIGFAETATAIAGVAAGCLGDECLFLTTTRETYPDGEWLEFCEAHSHATEQRLFAGHLTERLERTGGVILLDDEFSTGHTLLDMVDKMWRKFPSLREKKIIAASVLNRLEAGNEEELTEAGITAEYLLKLPVEDYAAGLEGLDTAEAEDPATLPPPSREWRRLALDALPNPRYGVVIGEYRRSLSLLNEGVLAALGGELAAAQRLVVLGTEECMLPALCLGAAIEKAFPQTKVRCHATTRSPIGVATDPGYPIGAGYRLPSFYEESRTTYIYNLAAYDIALVLTDAPAPGNMARECLRRALGDSGCRRVIFLEAG